jgi:hypothetical protein
MCFGYSSELFKFCLSSAVRSKLGIGSTELSEAQRNLTGNII